MPLTWIAERLETLKEACHETGWQVPAYSMPANRQDMVVQRIIVRLGVSRDLAGLLIANFKSAIEYLTRHPASVTAGQQDGTAFHH